MLEKKPKENLYDSLFKEKKEWNYNLLDFLKNQKSCELKLDRFCIDDKDITFIAEFINNRNCNLKKLSLQLNRIEAKGVDAIYKILIHNLDLEILDLYSNEIGDMGSEKLAKALIDSDCNLSELFLGCNRVGDLGVKAIASSLTNFNCQLKKLHLQANNIGDDGFMALADSLINPNCQLTELNLNWNDVTQKGFLSILSSLRNSNCKITKCYIDEKYQEMYDEAIGIRLKKLEPNNIVKVEKDIKQAICNEYDCNIF